MAATPSELAAFAKAKAISLGFALCGVADPLPRRNSEFYDWWVAQGFGAGMHYLRAQRARRASLERVVKGARSVVVCGLRFPADPAPHPSPRDGRVYGKIARYARHEDYHGRILPLLEELARCLDGAAGVKGSRAYVDTGPISERAFAARAGIGWIGKHSLVINREEGSWLWLGEVITPAGLAPDSPAADHCGRCRRCVDACPTGAILEELRAVDSRKCLAYWNIEHRGPIPPELHASMGDWLLGCDICQEVCPWNAQSARRGRPDPQPEYVPVDEILALTPAEFSAHYGGRAVERARPEGLARNARIVKGNAGKGS